jgi:hypothetical protein
MPSPLDRLLRGPLYASGRWPLLLRARCCEWRPAFLPKGRVGRHHRAVSRNGRVLLASDLALPELVGRVVRLRLQTWHRALVPGDAPTPYGVLLCAWAGEADGCEPGMYEARLVETASDDSELVVDVGGLRVLELRLKQGLGIRG